MLLKVLEPEDKCSAVSAGVQQPLYSLHFVVQKAVSKNNNNNNNNPELAPLEFILLPEDKSQCIFISGIAQFEPALAYHPGILVSSL